MTRWQARPRTLRFRLVLITSALTLVALIIFGAVSYAVLRQNLVSQALDTLELANDSATTQLASKLELTGALPGPNDFVPVPPSDGFFAVLSGGESVLSAYLSSEYDYRPLTDHEAASLWAHRGISESGGTVELGDLGTFMVTVSELPDADGTQLLVMSGINLKTTEEVSTTYLLAVSGLGIAIALASAFAGSRMVRGALRPLERVAHVADRVASAPLDSGEVPHQGRVPRDPKQAGSEADRVAEALNRLLANVETSLNNRHRTEESMRRFVAEASHELRNPLAAIRGYADFYAAPGSPNGDPEAQGALKRIGAEATRMGTLVDDLLALARLDADHPLQDEEVELTQVLVETFADARMTHKDHEWRLFVPDEAIVLRGDEHAVRQILINLLGNAGVHTPAGTEVRLSLERAADALIITVADNGPGIAAEDLPRIFDRFSQVGTSTRHRNSVGLGLAIVRALCTAAGYEVAAESGATGTRFTVTISAAALPA